MIRKPNTPLSQLVELFGPELITTDEIALEAINTDQRKIFKGKALALALPKNTPDIIKILKFCYAQNIAVVPQGGNTGYCGAATPDETGTQLVLSLRRMNKVRSIDPVNNSIVVEAGCILANVQRAAEEVDRFFPLSLGAEGSCQIGGNLSTNAGGVNVLRYGMTRDLVLGLEVVLADGRVLNKLTALRKDNTGYDLRHLFIGAEGTLGVISAACLKLFSAPKSIATAFVAIPDVNAAIKLLTKLRSSSGDLISSLELIPHIGLELVLKHIENTRAPLVIPSPWYVLCEITSAQVTEPLVQRLEEILTAALENGLISDAAIAQNERERQDFWRIRKHIPEAQRHEGHSIKHDISVPINYLPSFVEQASAWVAQNVPEALLVCYGHVGDGNLHFNINERRENNQRKGTNQNTLANNLTKDYLVAYEANIQRAIHDFVSSYNGSFSAEHGIGKLKVDELEHYTETAELGMMRSIKKIFDPKGIMNPGKVLRGHN